VFDHVSIWVSDFDASRAFYTTALAAIGIEPGYANAESQLAAWADFSLSIRAHDGPATKNLHLGLAAPSRAQVDAFWAELTAASYPDDGAPGPRPQYTETYYGAFVRDPDGNSVEAMHEEPSRADGVVHHLWLRVADVAATRRFYGAIAPAVGLRPGIDEADHVQFVGDGMLLSCVSGAAPTENLHLAFKARDNDRVGEFHAAGIAAGFADNGGPGERRYHDGYYAAFLFDPDGNNIEAVCHNRE
jgi:catechol 2,3-dioxygenase-like lactoylglutathione lyase family enzyme